MRAREGYDQWKKNSLINMNSPEDWRPVFVGLGILFVLVGAAFVQFYLEQRRQKEYELELS